MVSWDPARYLQFDRERTQPCRDLVARIDRPTVRRIVDLGCGPGNSTAVLRARWPGAACVGVDNSPEMLDVARRSNPAVEWVLGDIQTWKPRGDVDLIFSNAALHWIPDHANLVPRLFRMLSTPGTLAVQMPANSNAPYQMAAARVMSTSEWQVVRPGSMPEVNVGEPRFYYDLLAPMASRVQLWDTTYVHVLEGPEAIVEWTKGAGLRPWLASLKDDGQRERFLAEYLRELERAYPRQAAGTILFPFHRRFLVADRA